MTEESREFRAQIDARQMLTGMVERANQTINQLMDGNPIGALIRTRALESDLVEIEKLLVASLHGNPRFSRSARGVSWSDIGGWLGITKQAAQQKFGGFVNRY